MKRIVLLLLVLALGCTTLSGYRILYAEQYYRLFHLHFYRYPDDCMENIHYLEEALKADFCNPLYALAEIRDKRQWERYRYLFRMHVNLLLIRQYLRLGSGWDKQVAYFYNAPWKEQNLKSLDTAEEIYRVALHYWDQALKWSGEVKNVRLHLESAQFWEDEHYRIETGELDYSMIIRGHLDRLQRVRETFENMAETTY